MLICAADFAIHITLRCLLRPHAFLYFHICFAADTPLSFRCRQLMPLLTFASPPHPLMTLTPPPPCFFDADAAIFTDFVIDFADAAAYFLCHAFRPICDAAS